jgi:hypothetical protein
MKKLLMILMSVGIISGASAQIHGGGHFGGGYYGGGFRGPVVVGGYGYAPFYGYPGWYLGLGYPFYPSPYGYRNGYSSSRLQSQVASIKQDYADRIYSVHNDNTLTGKEKRQKIRELKHERDNAVASAKSNYWRNRQNAQPNNNNQQSTPQNTQPNTPQNTQPSTQPSTQPDTQ